MYIGSADLMERNLDRRVETLCPVRSPALAAHLRELVLDVYLRDNERAYVLVDRAYRRVERGDSEPAINAQEVLLQWHAGASNGEEGFGAR